MPKLKPRIPLPKKPPKRETSSKVYNRKGEGKKIEEEIDKEISWGPQAKIAIYTARKPCLIKKMKSLVTLKYCGHEKRYTGIAKVEDLYSINERLRDLCQDASIEIEYEYEPTN